MDNHKTKINLLVIQEFLEHLLSQAGYYYIGNKSNQKKVVEFFNSLPFFFFNEEIQNKLFVLIRDSELKSYIDNNDDMKEYCYMIYKKFSNHLNLKVKDKTDFYHDLQQRLHNETYTYKKIKQNNLHTYIFIIIMLCFAFFYYFFIYRK